MISQQEFTSLISLDVPNSPVYEIIFQIHVQILLWIHGNENKFKTSGSTIQIHQLNHGLTYLNAHNNKVWCSSLESKSSQCEICIDLIQGGKKCRESSNIKRMHVSALTGLVPRKIAKGSQRVSALHWNWTKPLDSLQLTLTTKPWVCASLKNKTVY